MPREQINAAIRKEFPTEETLLQQRHSNFHIPSTLLCSGSFYCNGSVHHHQTVLVLEACDVFLVETGPTLALSYQGLTGDCIVPDKRLGRLAFKEPRAYFTPVQRASLVCQDEKKRLWGRLSGVGRRESQRQLSSQRDRFGCGF